MILESCIVKYGEIAEMDHAAHAAHGRTTNLPWSQALLVAAISLCANGSLGLDNGMGLQPPMGTKQAQNISNMVLCVCQ